MKNKLTRTIKPAALLLLAALNHQYSTAFAQSAAFTYQGRLDTNGVAATGSYDLEFYLRDAETEGNPASITNELAQVGVTNGLFTVTLNFGNDPFSMGAPRWLEIGVRESGTGPAYAILSPRQALTATPYALTAGNLTGNLPASQLSGALSSAQFSGNYSSQVTLNNAANVISGIGSGLTGLDAGNIFSGTLSGDRLPGNIAWLDRGQVFTGNNWFANVAVHGSLAVDPNTSLFSGLGIDDWWTTARTTSDSTNSYFLRVRSGLNPKYGTYRNPVFLVRGDGQVGIGTSNPTKKLEVDGAGDVEMGLRSTDNGGHLWTLQSSGVTGGGLDATFQVIDRTLGVSRLAIDTNGQVFWGSSYLSRDQNGCIELGDSTAASGVPYIDFHMGVGQIQDFNVRLVNDADGQLSLYGNLNTSGNASCCSLTVRGGCDLAEPFELSSREIPKGSLVIIDEENPGKLKLACEGYDTRVAGIVSGANGVNPGISLHQEGVMEAGQNIALSGRVYALADASYGAIKPGDLLTSSSTPGHVMKAADQSQAQGAIVGKAMSSLKQGKGMVLVLVSLQ